QHFHADHPVFSCSKSEQKQLNTWVSFQSAEQPLLGQFSVSDNTLLLRGCDALLSGLSRLLGRSSSEAQDPVPPELPVHWFGC
ncbi:hypothetical protein, partial [Pseudomonas amygdali]|uniref:hypothetical protein n=1 Tax=Pseudomonas amygdali TaxID=47877 RepID=UPI001CA4B784